MIDSLLDNIEAYSKAKRDYEEKSKTCEYDRGYFLYREQERIDIAREEAEATLNGIIDQRIHVALQRMGVLEDGAATP